MPETKHKGAATKLAVEQETSSHISVHPLYTPADLEGWEYDRDLNYPGRISLHARSSSDHVSRPPVDHAAVRRLGRRRAIERTVPIPAGKGTTGLSVAFDLPTQIGLDSDHPRAVGEVGKVGVAIDSLEDMETLFEGIPLDGVSTSMTINATAAILLALYVAVAKKQGADIRKLSGTVQNDILKEYIARGTYIYPPPVHAHRDRSFRVVPHGTAGLEHDFDFRIPHS